MPENKLSNGFLIAAPHSGSGKTVITLGLIRALRNAGIAVGSAKAGPDFIDPVFHAKASGNPCVNLDPWAMRPELIKHLAARQQQSGCFVVEAMMGLFDGAADGSGSAADLSILLKLPVILVVDAAKQSHSIGALVRGFRDHRTECNVAGVILNRVGSQRHEAMLREALAAIDMPVFGAVPRDEKLALPSRHLGLVQAEEHEDIEEFIVFAAQQMAKFVQMERFFAQETAKFVPGGGENEPSWKVKTIPLWDSGSPLRGTRLSLLPIRIC